MAKIVRYNYEKYLYIKKYLYIRYNYMKNICRIKNKMEEGLFLIEKWGKKFTKERKLTNNIYKKYLNF